MSAIRITGNHPAARLPEEFRPVYRYVMRDGKPQDEELLDGDLWEKSGVVYARVYQDEPVYIGSTDRLLRERIKGHLRGIAKSRQPAHVDYREWAKVSRSPSSPIGQTLLAC